MWFGPLLIKNPGYAYGPACSYSRKKAAMFWPTLKEILPPLEQRSGCGTDIKTKNVADM